MNLEEFEESVSNMAIAVRFRRLPTEVEFHNALRHTDAALSNFEDSTELPKRVVRGLLDLVSMILVHAPDNEDETRLIEMYVEIDELLTRRIP